MTSFNKRVALSVVLAADYFYVGYSSSTSTKLIIGNFVDITQMKMIPKKINKNIFHTILFFIGSSREGPAAPDGPPLHINSPLNTQAALMCHENVMEMFHDFKIFLEIMGNKKENVSILIYNIIEKCTSCTY